MFCAEEASWTAVGNNYVDRSNNFFRPSISFANAVRGNPLAKPNAIPVRKHQQSKSVFDRLLF